VDEPGKIVANAVLGLGVLVVNVDYVWNEAAPPVELCPADPREDVAEKRTRDALRLGQTPDRDLCAFPDRVNDGPLVLAHAILFAPPCGQFAREPGISSLAARSHLAEAGVGEREPIAPEDRLVLLVVSTHDRSIGTDVDQAPV
jgi:hypothetical protein